MKNLIIFFIIVILVAVLAYFGSGGIYNLYLENRYPLRYRDHIEKYADQFGLKSSFVSAVIYEESRFNANSNSSQGAIGLMQILPSTGRYIAGALGEEGFSDNMLSNEETNIRYGCFYLSYLTKKYDSVEKILAAYNAGEGTVDKWLLGDEFEIRFQETAAFVRSVQNTQNIYTKLYFDE